MKNHKNHRIAQYPHWILGLALPSALHLPFAFYALFTIFTLNSRPGPAQCPAPCIRILCALYDFHIEFSAWLCPVPCILGAGSRMSPAPTLSMNDIKTNRVRTQTKSRSRRSFSFGCGFSYNIYAVTMVNKKILIILKTQPKLAQGLVLLLVLVILALPLSYNTSII